MKYIVPIVLVLSSNALGATSPKICGLKSGATLRTYQDSIDEIVANVSPTIATALTELEIMPDVQGLIESAKPDQVCISAVAVSKNIYQYDEVLAVLDLHLPSGKEWVTPMLFQTASIQAFENTGPKPWVGFDRVKFTSMMSDALADADFSDSEADTAFSPLSLFPRLFPKIPQPIDNGSQSYVYVPGVTPGWTTYLVTELRVYDTGNIFTSSYFTDMGVVQIQEESGKLRSTVLPQFFDLYTQMGNLQDQATPDNLTDSARIGKLQALSSD
jgi:hypothetical protein